jgi:pyruvate dehydrogenase E1 component
MFGEKGEDVLFYLTLYNEVRRMPARPPEATDEAIAKGIYRLRKSAIPGKKAPKVHLLSSGTILFEALKAAEILENEGISTDVWSVTSWTELYRDADDCRQHNQLYPAEPPRVAHLTKILEGEGGVFVAVSDWMRLLPSSLEPCIPGPYSVLGTDGFGFSDSRENLRRFFKISSTDTASAAMRLLFAAGKISMEKLNRFSE